MDIGSKVSSKLAVQAKGILYRAEQYYAITTDDDAAPGRGQG